MTALQTISVYLVTTGFFFVIDLVWLGFIGKDIYKSYLGYLMRDPINWTAAVIFYLLFIVGLMYFALMPALKEGVWVSALTYGALFGFFTYATYDLTNLATVKDWPLTISLIDMAWGTVLSATVSVCGFFVATKYII